MNKIVSIAKSKTLWFMGIVTAGGFAQYLTPFIPPQYLPLVTAGVGLAGIVLRSVTTQPVTEKTP